MNKTLISIAAILSIAGLVGWYMYLQNARYTVVGTQRGIAYEIDRKSGESWTISPGKRKQNIDYDPKSEVVTERSRSFPIEEKAKITGYADLAYGFLKGKLYNGSTWTVKEVIVTVKVLEKDGSTRWDRQFREMVTIQPLTTVSFMVEVGGDSDIGSFEWALVQVNGIPPE